MDVPFFADLCPKCNHPATLSVHGWTPVTDEFGDGGTVYFVVHCEQCLSYTGGILYYDPLGAVMSDTLADYADEKNNVTRFFKREKFNYDFDYRNKPFKHPLVLKMLCSKNSHAATLGALLQQIYTCMDLKCWDAVGILCRKIIDIETTTLWNMKFSHDTPPGKELQKSLFERITDLFPNKKNPIHHIAHVIRLEGNSAAHGNVLLTQDDARMILTFTEGLLKKNGMNHDLSSLAGKDQETI